MTSTQIKMNRLNQTTTILMAENLDFILHFSNQPSWYRKLSPMKQQWNKMKKESNPYQASW
jgi:hypothetical protein